MVHRMDIFEQESGDEKDDSEDDHDVYLVSMV